MATKPAKVTEMVFYDYVDIMRICGVGRGKAYAIIRDINKKLAENNKLFLPGRVSAVTFNSMFN